MRTSTRSDYERRMCDVLDHLRDHLDGQLDLNALASVASLSPFHFHRVFQGMLRESACDLVKRIRLERAAHHLGTTSCPITEIAFEAGYATHEAFIRAFRAAFGTTPSEFRRGPIGDGSLPCPNGVHYRQMPGREIQFAGGVVHMQVEIREIPSRKVVCLPHKGEYWKIGRTFGELCQWLGQRQIPFGPCLGIFHNDPAVTPVDQLKSEAASFVADDFTVDDPVAFTQQIEGGTYAVATHVGSYDTLGNSWEELCGRWLPSSGREPDEAPTFEIYVDDCSVVDPKQCRTELHIKLKG